MTTFFIPVRISWVEHISMNRALKSINRFVNHFRRGHCQTSKIYFITELVPNYNGVLHKGILKYYENCTTFTQ